MAGMRGTALALCIVALVLPPAASAGSLSKVVSGLGAATGSSSRPAPPASSSPSGPTTSGVWVDSEGPSYPAGVVTGGSGSPSYPGPDVTLELGVGLMSVHDSDGSLAFEIGVSHEDFGLLIRGRSFFEEQETSSTLRMDLGSITGQFRFIDDPLTNIWLEGGVGGVATIDDIHAYGALAGLRLERRLVGDFILKGAARYYFLADGIRLIELGGGIRLGWIELWYRLFDFNVGPPLHGPEVAVTLRF
jgi:hypothetical protein